MEISLQTCDAPPPIGARSLPVGSKGLHLWGSVAPGPDLFETWRDPTAYAQFMRDCVRTGGGLWQITSTAKEYRRVVSEGSLLPLPDIAISQIPPGVDPFTRRTVVQLRVQANDGADERVFDMDANQSVTIVAQDVCVYWLGPEGMIDLLNLGDGQRDLPLSGMVIDSFLGASISRIEQDPGNNSEVILTRHLYVPAATRGSTAIPSYAREVTIYQEPTLGTSSVMWTQTLGDPNGVSGSMTLAALPFIVGQRKTQPEAILPHASHLYTDIDPGFARFFTLVYVVRP